MPPSNPSFHDVWQMVADMPGAQLVFLVLFFGTWLVGGNLVIARHYRRQGQSAWSGFKPFAFPWRNFTLRDWLALLAVAVLATAFGIVSLLMGENSR